MQWLLSKENLQETSGLDMREFRLAGGTQLLILASRRKDFHSLAYQILQRFPSKTLDMIAIACGLQPESPKAPLSIDSNEFSSHLNQQCNTTLTRQSFKCITCNQLLCHSCAAHSHPAGCMLYPVPVANTLKCDSTHKPDSQ